jgi:hypothetical protein
MIDNASEGLYRIRGKAHSRLPILSATLLINAALLDLGVSHVRATLFRQKLRNLFIRSPMN